MVKHDRIGAASASIGTRVKRVLILGIGNILLRDEGVGVRVVEALMRETWPDHVEIIDGGTAGADLVNIMADRQKVIIVDAFDGQAAPGTVVQFDGDQLIPEPHTAVSLHQVGLVDSLVMAKQLGCAPRQVVVIGVQPAEIRPGLELSPEVQRAIPAAIDAVRREVAPGHVTPTPHVVRE